MIMCEMPGFINAKAQHLLGSAPHGQAFSVNREWRELGPIKLDVGAGHVGCHSFWVFTCNGWVVYSSMGNE